MNTKLATWFALLSASGLTVQGQLFSSESVGGAALGGLIGGIVGHNSGGHTAEGVGIGAGAGLLLGALAHDARRDQGYYVAPVSYPAYPAYGYYGYGAYPAYGYSVYRPNYAISGAAVGGLAGGIIGHNSHGRTLEGIGIGAGAGLLLGGLAEANARHYERVAYASPPAVYYAPASYPAPLAYSTTPPAPVTSTPAAPTVPTPTSLSPSTTINNQSGSGSPMSGANSLFGR